jgi:hypothetical protein
MRIARVVGSLPRLRRWFVTRLSPERVIFNTAFEEPAQAVSSVHVKPGLADQTPSKSLLTLSAIRVLAAALVVVTLIPNLILGAIFCAGCLFAELREYWRAAVFGRRLRVSDRRKRGTHIAGALGSLPHLPQQLAPTLRSRRPRGRSQWNVYTAVEKPAQRASSVNVRPIFADRARLVSSSLNCALVAGLILLALIPNLVLGGIFWLGAVNISWSRFPTHTADDKTVAPQSVVPAPVLSSPPTMEASVGRDIPFPIALDGTDGVPARSIIAVRGLPQGSKLSSGRPYDETEWNLKPDEIGDLHLVLPNNARGEAKLIVQLVAVDGAVITDTTTFLEILTNSAETKIEPTQTQVLGERGKAVEEKHAEVAHANLNAATVTPEDPIQLPLRRPIQSSSDDARWTVLTAVNLRERPTRSAPAIGVVAKGTKLYLISRQRSWVRVNNPATSEEGWIYGRHVAVASLR